ncbi:MAG: hypothetical protein BJ554DRAFT_5235 [Olpidium bornovanus]|uniref:Uncharacterized protein n=1 Tax=Olpidium bornovanus TaxID=278681 RepID=A0A8H7ZII4_9FUNG|nr:MAG: hypothetical protein BJ554DRAFT_5235 [Olpidium bornovanus]
MFSQPGSAGGQLRFRLQADHPAAVFRLQRGARLTPHVLGTRVQLP